MQIWDLDATEEPPAPSRPSGRRRRARLVLLVVVVAVCAWLLGRVEPVSRATSVEEWCARRARLVEAVTAQPAAPPDGVACARIGDLIGSDADGVGWRGPGVPREGSPVRRT